MKKPVVILISAIALAVTTGAKAQEELGRSPAVTEHEQNKVQYTCPMHSDVVLDRPGTCPKCGMTLVLKKESKRSTLNAKRSTSNSRHAHMNADGMAMPNEHPP